MDKEYWYGNESNYKIYRIQEVNVANMKPPKYGYYQTPTQYFNNQRQQIPLHQPPLQRTYMNNSQNVIITKILEKLDDYNSNTNLNYIANSNGNVSIPIVTMPDDDDDLENENSSQNENSVEMKQYNRYENYPKKGTKYETNNLNVKRKLSNQTSATPTSPSSLTKPNNNRNFNRPQSIHDSESNFEPCDVNIRNSKKVSQILRKFSTDLKNSTPSPIPKCPGPVKLRKQFSSPVQPSTQLLSPATSISVNNSKIRNSLHIDYNKPININNNTKKLARNASVDIPSLSDMSVYSCKITNDKLTSTVSNNKIHSNGSDKENKYLNDDKLVNTADEVIAAFQTPSQRYALKSQMNRSTKSSQYPKQQNETISQHASSIEVNIIDDNNKSNDVNKIVTSTGSTITLPISSITKTSSVSSISLSCNNKEKQTPLINLILKFESQAANANGKSTNLVKKQHHFLKHHPLQQSSSLFELDQVNKKTKNYNSTNAIVDQANKTKNFFNNHSHHEIKRNTSEQQSNNAYKTKNEKTNDVNYKANFNNNNNNSNIKMNHRMNNDDKHIYTSLVLELKNEDKEVNDIKNQVKQKKNLSQTTHNLASKVNQKNYSNSPMMSVDESDQLINNLFQPIIASLDNNYNKSEDNLESNYNNNKNDNNNKFGNLNGGTLNRSYSIPVVNEYETQPVKQRYLIPKSNSNLSVSSPSLVAEIENEINNYSTDESICTHSSLVNLSQNSLNDDTISNYSFNSNELIKSIENVNEKSLNQSCESTANTNTVVNPGYGEHENIAVVNHCGLNENKNNNNTSSTKDPIVHIEEINLEENIIVHAKQQKTEDFKMVTSVQSQSNTNTIDDSIGNDKKNADDDDGADDDAFIMSENNELYETIDNDHQETVYNGEKCKRKDSVLLDKMLLNDLQPFQAKQEHYYTQRYVSCFIFSLIQLTFV